MAMSGGTPGVRMMPPSAVVPAPASSASRQASLPSEDMVNHIRDLINSERREQALLHLSKHRESFPDLAPMLWWSFGTMAALMQEIVSIYPSLSPPLLTSQASNRVCNALALLQCVASHADTRGHFLKANIALYLYPFLRTSSTAKAFEYLRLTSLGVIGALVKHDDAEVVDFLIASEVIPLCLAIMEHGTELSKTVAVFILEKIIVHEKGLNYVCQTPDRFFSVHNVLLNMVTHMVSKPSSRLLKHVIRCYLRLADHEHARDALRSNLPEPLRDGSFKDLLRADINTERELSQLLDRISAPAS